MSKHIQLDIPQPCHENWNKMTPSEKGRFCNACQKQVVDFTGMSDTQVATFFKKAEGSVCGRFMQDQLNREMEIPKKRIPWVKYFFQFALPAFLMSAKVKAQGEIRILKGDTTVSPVSSLVRGKVAVSKCELQNTRKEKIIKGKVFDSNGNPLVGATIMVKGTTIGTSADNIGNFQLTYKGEKDKIVVVASYVGFQTVEISVDLDKPEGNNIQMSLYEQLSGEVMVLGYAIPKKKKKKSILLITSILKDTVFSNFKIFPNPVTAGTNLNIEVKEKIKEGYYTLDLINQSGQSVYQREIWIDEEARLLNIDVPVVKTGNYFITITNKKSGKRFTEKLIIQ